ncbi:hypothetical protein QUV83_08590 [Cellulomonas cellasea]|uniref:hypothetical protein n=1 Tax=Cellulomonas cellasea TaxID=43670 RepID=UPI0025A422C9|nr:hypothetical protein [Cellulomonas cellasea]MDM8084818.1 hypothetical protein [Cellulomonas cellasea]
MAVAGTAVGRGRRGRPVWRAVVVGLALLSLAACAADTGATPDGQSSTGSSKPTDWVGPTAADSGVATAAPTPGPHPTPITIAESFGRNDDADVAPAARDANPSRLLVTTWGSSTCPDLPVSMEWDAGRTVLSVRAEFDNGRADTPCTLDYVPTTSVLVVEDLPATEFTVRVNDVGTVVAAVQ